MRKTDDLPVLKLQHRLDETRDTAGDVEVPEVAFGCADMDSRLLLAGQPRSVGAVQAGHLDRVAKRSGCAVRFDVRDGLGCDARHLLRRDDHIGLALDARRGVGTFRRAIVVGGEATDYRQNGVAVGLRIFETLEHDDSGSGAEDCALRAMIKGTDDAIERDDATFFRKVAAPLREGDGDAAGERHVAAICQQTLAGMAHRDQRGRAGGLHRDTGSAQIELPTDARGQKVLIVAHHGHVGASLVIGSEALEECTVVREIVQQIGVQRRAGEDTDGGFRALRIVSCAFKCLPANLEEDAMLRVHLLGFAGIDVKEGSIEQIDIVEHRACREVAGLRCDFGGDFQFLGREAANGLFAGQQVLP